MITNDLQHILEGSHCLSKRQLRDYAADSLSREEAYAVECHLAECPLCSAAADGMLAHFPESAAVLAGMDTGFLTDHFKNHSPQIHLNAVAPPVAMPANNTGRRRTSKVVPLPGLRIVGIAAALALLTLSVWWVQKDSREKAEPALLAQALPDDAAAKAGQGVNAPSSLEEEARLQPAAGATQSPVSSNASIDKTVAKAPDADRSQVASSLQQAAPARENSVNSAGAAAAPAGSSTEAAPDQKFGGAPPSDIRTRRYAATPQATAKPARDDKDARKESARNPMEVAASAPVAKRSDAATTAAVVDEADDATSVQDGLSEGKRLYRKGSYSAALKLFRREMSASSGADQQEASLYAARCYRALGQKASAEKLLEELAAGSGARSRAARRELRDMEEAAQEASPRRAKGRSASSPR